MLSNYGSHPMYKRAVLYFIVYSAILFFATATNFGSLKSILYFLVGFALSGIVAIFFMLIQRRMEERLEPTFWILNILIEIIGYYLFTQLLFLLFF